MQHSWMPTASKKNNKRSQMKTQDSSNVDHGRMLTSRFATASSVPWCKFEVARFLSCSWELAKALTPNNESKGATLAKKMKNKNGIPDRWEDYQAVGKRIPGTRFIAFKVPLKQSLNCRVPMSDVFGPWELMDALEKEKQELGLIIDLTFTTRYYKVQDVPESLFCVKIFTAGHEIPSDDNILSFKRAVRRFLHDNADNDKLVGVHCTHGLNRTGYLVCRYLIDVDGMDPKKAVELFNSSRGHPIERENYLNDLQSGPKRSNEGMEESEQEPARGLAVERAPYIPFDPTEERPPHAYNHYDHRPPQHRGMNRPPHGGLLPPPLLPLPHFPPHLLPNPRFPRPMAPYRAGPPLSPYQWRPPPPDYQWRRPPHPEEHERRRAPHPEEHERRRAPHPEEHERRRAPHPDEHERRRAPHPEEHERRRAPHPEESRHRAPHPEEHERRRGHYPPAPPPPPPHSALPRYAPSAFSTDEPNDQNTGRTRRPSRRHKQRHRD